MDPYGPCDPDGFQYYRWWKISWKITVVLLPVQLMKDHAVRERVEQKTDERIIVHKKVFLLSSGKNFWSISALDEQ